MRQRDRMTIDSLIECMGVGRDRKLKIKDEKIQALLAWNTIGPTRLGVYDQTLDHWYEAPIEQWAHACLAHGRLRTFDDNGKAYYELHVNDFPADPQEIPAHEEAA